MGRYESKEGIVSELEELFTIKETEEVQINGKEMQCLPCQGYGGENQENCIYTPFLLPL